MAMDRKARLKGDEWARIWTYEAERVAREGAPLRLSRDFHAQRHACSTQTPLCSVAIHCEHALRMRWHVYITDHANQQPLRCACSAYVVSTLGCIQWHGTGTSTWRRRRT